METPEKELGQATQHAAGGGIEEERRDTEVKLKENGEMKPWEQHSAVISIPRFDYKAPSSLLRHAHSGFLITCSIKREKSATKEAMSLLGKFVGHMHGMEAESFDSSDANVSAKRRRMCNDKEGELEIGLESGFDVDKSGERGAGEKTETCTILSLVKLTKSGLLLLTFPMGAEVAVVDILSNFIESLDGGSIPSPLWCHRIFPIQSTCCLHEEELQKVVSRLVNQFVNDKQNKITMPLKFAVGYNRRGIEENETDKRASSSGAPVSLLLDRGKCFSLVAATVKGVVADSVVDLKSPELAVLVEVLPVSGIPDKRVMVGVSVLPRPLISTKPRLCVKALVSETKSRSGRKDQQ